jgi:uncharacterized membrane protein required for colicin V production
MLVLFFGVLVGMCLGVAVMLLISWATCLRHENTTVKEHLKDLASTLSSAPEYRNQ